MSFWPFGRRAKQAQQEQQRGGPPVVVPFLVTLSNFQKRNTQPSIADRDGPAVPELREGIATITDAARSRVISAPPEVQRQAVALVRDKGSQNRGCGRGKAAGGYSGVGTRAGYGAGFSNQVRG